MTHYIGIDLGTTNSAVCSYDGTELRVWKDPNQNDVTPSALYFDRRGGRHVGRRAYDRSAQDPDRAATLFKRFMGTGHRVELPAVGQSLTPEECSAAVLQTLHGYLPEEMRAASDGGTVITVPAAFNQMQKDATMQAAEIAGIGQVALMQEPVAAVMSVMRTRQSDGIFMIFDLGGGTLDIALAESMGGRVNLLAHGGIAMCGGRDWDRLLLDNIVKPWLQTQFDLPADLTVNADYRPLLRLAAWAAEKAKIELSARDEGRIGLDEGDIRMEDLSGNELYLDITVTRAELDQLIADRVQEAIEAARETLADKAGLTGNDIERIVFVGGPTKYGPLRERLSQELGIAASTEVDPMTAVAAGAAVFAESIDWSDQRRERKSARGTLRTEAAGGDAAAPELIIKFNARTPDASAKLAVRLAEEISDKGFEIQLDSIDTGWTSGRINIDDGAKLKLPLAKQGGNRFKISLFDGGGRALKLPDEQIVITRTAATVDSIPASHSIGMEVRDDSGVGTTLDWLVRAGEHLPVKGQRRYRTEETLRAGASGALNFKLWEGEIEDEVKDNRFIGCFKITGQDFDEGVIAAGSELQLDYEILDSGQVVCEVSIPSIGATMRSGNFYSRQEGARPLDPALVRDEAQTTLERLARIKHKVDDPRLEKAQARLEGALDLPAGGVEDEVVQQAMEDVLKARRMLAEVRQAHRADIRRLDLDDLAAFYEQFVRPAATEPDQRNYNALLHTAERSLERGDKSFEGHLDELKGRNFEILWAQDWFVIDYYKRFSANPAQFSDMDRYRELAALGAQALARGDVDALREITGALHEIRIVGIGDGGILEDVVITRG